MPCLSAEMIKIQQTTSSYPIIQSNSFLCLGGNGERHKGTGIFAISKSIRSNGYFWQQEKERETQHFSAKTGPPRDSFLFLLWHCRRCCSRCYGISLDFSSRLIELVLNIHQSIQHKKQKDGHAGQICISASQRPRCQQWFGKSLKLQLVRVSALDWLTAHCRKRSVWLRTSSDLRQRDFESIQSQRVDARGHRTQSKSTPRLPTTW